MKRVMAFIMSIIAVFCVFAGCNGASKVQDNDASDTGINLPKDKEDGENQGGGNKEPEENDDGQGEEDPNGQGEENPDGQEGQGEGKSTYVIVDPITDGGEFDGGNYN